MTTERDKEAIDELVSQTYREHSVEQAPERLNQEILSMATDDASRGSRTNFLFAAWTKPLAWAATIGISLAVVLELSQVPGSSVDIAAPAAESIREEFAQQRTDVLDEARKQASQESGQNQNASLADEVTLQDADVAIIGKQNEFSKLVRPVPAAEKTPSDVERPCDAITRESAEDWLRCIEELREAGAVDAANREYEAYFLEYPVE
ncbi:MAG: hypothetical protein IH838_09225 [Proteobacteria bacterium]|nr:hypothetical protein [Pseudomonadota bacterium]